MVVHKDLIHRDHGATLKVGGGGGQTSGLKYVCVCVCVCERGGGLKHFFSVTLYNFQKRECVCVCGGGGGGG